LDNNVETNFGGKPNKGTPADKRISTNKPTSKKSSTKKK
jgi:hypothetical protein